MTGSGRGSEDLASKISTGNRRSRPSGLVRSSRTTSHPQRCRRPTVRGAAQSPGSNLGIASVTLVAVAVGTGVSIVDVTLDSLVGTCEARFVGEEGSWVPFPEHETRAANRSATMNLPMRPYRTQSVLPLVSFTAGSFLPLAMPANYALRPSSPVFWSEGKNKRCNDLLAHHIIPIKLSIAL